MGKFAQKFKHWKVRAKILLAFGMILLVMCVAVLFVALANAKVIEHVNIISGNTSFQRELSDVLESYNEADIQANILYSVIDPEAREAFALHTGNTEERFQIVLAHADSHRRFESFRPTIQNAYDQFSRWKTAINELVQRDIELEEGRKTFSASGSELVEGIGAFISYQVEHDVTTEQMLLANQISDNVTAFRLLSRTFQYALDSSYVEQIIQKMDETIVLLERYRGNAGSAEEAQAAQKLIDIINKRYAYTNDFALANDASDAAQEHALPLGAAATAAINTAVDDVYQGIEERVSTTKSTAIFSLIVMIFAMGIVLVVAIIIAFALAKTITLPLAKMQRIMEQAGTTGNLHYSEEMKKDILKEAAAKDEIGQSLAAFSSFVNHMVYAGECLTTIANNDLSLEIQALGPDDTMGSALKALTENMNASFQQIAMAADQVSTGSEQVSDTSIALSQGATEQASSVEELSAAMDEISAQTKQNADNANRANDLAGTAKINAQQGDSQMQEMLGAMREISEASANISRVIKVIDDIAFQTNILALNAAVEAARAGSAGRGFAVVAEEVRNLAVRSADAVKETTEMIEGSIQKTENGTKIADETAEALKKIVENIDHVASLIGNITAASDEQAQGIAQVNQGIMQVSQVVQTNAATSEESAAASQEMHSQAHLLKEMIARFKLRDAGSHPVIAYQEEYDAGFSLAGTDYPSYD